MRQDSIMPARTLFATNEGQMTAANVLTGDCVLLLPRVHFEGS